MNNNIDNSFKSNESVDPSYKNRIKTLIKLSGKMQKIRTKLGWFGIFILVGLCVLLHYYSSDKVQAVLSDLNILAMFDRNNSEETGNLGDTMEEVLAEDQKEPYLKRYKVKNNTISIVKAPNTKSVVKKFRKGDILIQQPHPEDISDTETEGLIYVKGYKGKAGWVNLDKLQELKGEVIDVKKATATSVLVTKKTKEKKKADFVIDGLMNTSWQEGAEADGIGESIRLEFEKEESLSKAIIINGNVSSKDSYFNNNRIKTATLKFSDGTTKKINFEDKFIIKGTEFSFKTPITAEWVDIVVDSVYKGAKYRDTCITEIIFFK